MIENMRSWNVKDRTFSSFFVVPMLEKQYSWLTKAGVVNVFIGDERYPEYHNHIFLLAELKTNHLYPMLSNKDFLRTYVTQYKIGKRFMFVYKVPEKFQEQYDLLVNRDYTYYSRLGANYTETILNCHECDTDSIIYKIIIKHEDMYKDWEDKINEGLPEDHHITIPRELEAAKRFNMNVEVFREHNEVAL